MPSIYETDGITKAEYGLKEPDGLIHYAGTPLKELEAELRESDGSEQWVLVTRYVTTWIEVLR